MPAVTAIRGPVWPLVALHSATVTDRGELIRRARELGRLSRRELAAATGIGARTIGRIETGKGGKEPRSLAVLEHALKGELHAIAIQDAAAAVGIPADANPPVDSATFLQLLAALAKRHAELEALLQREGLRDTPAVAQSDLSGVVAFRTEDAPSAKRVKSTTDASGEGHRRA